MYGVPKPGDLIIRDSNRQFVVTRIGSRKPLGPPCTTLPEALRLALESEPGLPIWCANVDHRGRPLGPAIQIHPAVS